MKAVLPVPESPCISVPVPCWKSVSYTHLDVYKRQDFALYQQDLAGVDFDLYFGEVKLQGNLDLTPFFSEESLLHSGIIGTEPVSYTHLDVYKRQG